MRQHYSDDASYRYRSTAYTRAVKITGTSMIPVEDAVRRMRENVGRGKHFKDGKRYYGDADNEGFLIKPSSPWLKPLLPSIDGEFRAFDGGFHIFLRMRSTLSLAVYTILNVILFMAAAMGSIALGFYNVWVFVFIACAFLGAFGLTYGCYLVMGFEKDRIFKLLKVVSTESNGAVHDRRKNDWKNY